MNSQFISLADIVDRTLLDFYLDEVCGLPCTIFDPQGHPVVKAGPGGEGGPTPVGDEIVAVSTAPLPVDITGGRAAGLFAKGELVGFASVTTKSEADAVAADFVFNLINHSITQRLDREGLEFTSEYLKNLINLMQGMSQKTAAVFDKERVAELFVHECEKLFGARSGAVLVLTEGRMRVLSSFGGVFSDVKAVEHACEGRRLYVNNTPVNDPMFSSDTPPDNIMVVPLLSGHNLIGALSLRDKQMGPFTLEDQRMAQTLSAVLGGTIANIQLHQSLVATEKVKATLSRYLSPNLLKEVVESGKFQALGGQRVRTAMLFTDIRGFTKLSEQVSPEQMVSQLNEYFEEMANVIFTYDGTLDKFVGDMIMVLFGVPKRMLDASSRAVKTAIDMQKRLKSLNKKWSAEGKPSFEVGMGINIGEVIFGNIGSSQAMGLTVIGDHVNTAQRLEAHAGAGEIIVSQAVHEDVLENGFKYAKLGLVKVKGKDTQIIAYRIDYD